MFAGALMAGQKNSEAAAAHGIPPSTAYDLANKFKDTGSVENLPRSGRPPTLSDQDKRQIIRTAKKQRRTAFADISNQLDLNVSKATIRVVLRSAGYSRHVA